MKYFKWREKHLYLHNIQFNVGSREKRGLLEDCEAI